jgi:hypothetical protein
MHGVRVAAVAMRTCTQLHGYAWRVGLRGKTAS